MELKQENFEILKLVHNALQRISFKNTNLLKDEVRLLEGINVIIGDIEQNHKLNRAKMRKKH